MEPFDHKTEFTLTQPPHPDWTPPHSQKLPHPFSKDRETFVKSSDLSAGEMYKMLISSVVPRPIALVSTCSKDNTGAPVNIAPFSYFNLVCHDPPTLMVSINYSRGQPKDSLRNIQETGEFVVNSFNEHFVESANHTSIPVPYEIEEDKLSGLTLVPSTYIKPKRVQESLVSFECRLSHCHLIQNAKGETSTGVVFGEVLGFMVKDGVWDPETKQIDMRLYKPVSRLGGNNYGRTESGYEILRPTI
ncbi:hypothetical protein HDU79_002243 [Rhizoclosmatium sp. JEL0117]|nr:hypothetical protein HDU79_002243 [Rhizoclosmatium sp. JEL0117]